jgi:hypothetical protein
MPEIHRGGVFLLLEKWSHREAVTVLSERDTLKARIPSLL